MTQDKALGSRRNQQLSWLIVIVISLISIGIELAGDGGRELLRYDREQLSGGELWRLGTGHVAHLGLTHGAVNLLALGILAGLFGDLLRPMHWLLGLAASILAIDAGLWWLAPQVEWYVGLSGVLHGLMVIGALAMAGNGEKLGWGLLVAVLAKLVWEQWIGPLPMTASTSGGEVVVDAHLFGSIGGLAVAFPIFARNALGGYNPGAPPGA